MKKNLFLLICCFALAGFFAEAKAQCPTMTTQGTEFIVVFMGSSGSSSTERLRSLLAAAERECVVTVYTGLYSGATLYSVDTVPANSSVEIGLPYVPDLYVTATDTIALYASNFRPATWDITTVLPVAALRDYYIIQTWNHNSIPGYDPSFSFRRVSQETIVTVRKRVYNLYSGNGAFTTTEYGTNAYSPYGPPLDFHCTNGYSLSGSEVIADGPLAVFQSHECAHVPTDYPACDHLYEQAIPVAYWGTDHVIVPTAERGYRQFMGFDEDSNIVWSDTYQPGHGDIVQVTSSADDCILWLDGVPIDTLQQFQTSMLYIPADTAKRLVTSRPVTVYLYLGGASWSGEYGDPSMVLVPPVEQGVKSTIFSSITTERTRFHFTNIVTRNSAVGGMKLDGMPIGTSFIQLDSLYSYARINVGEGPHRLTCDSGKFVAHFYGLGEDESYAYIAGMSLNDLSHLYVDGAVRRRVPDGVYACMDDTLMFNIATTVDDTATVWMIDGVVVEDSTLLHLYRAFQSPGKYTVSAVVAGRTCDTLSTNVYIDGYTYDTLVVNICEGQGYLWNDTLRTEDGFYIAPMGDSAICRGFSCLDLHLSSYSSYEFFDTICDGDGYSWNGRELTAAGDYRDTVATSEGCDTMLTLHLATRPLNMVAIYDTACMEGGYLWHGMTLTAAGDYRDTVGVTEGCDTITTLHLAAMSPPTVSIDYSGDCRTYTLVASGDGSHYRWSSSPHDPLLDGHENGNTVHVEPTEITAYTLVADYDDAFPCPSTATIHLAPAQQVVAAMEIVPPQVTTENLNFIAIDKTENASSRTWFLDDVMVGDAARMHLVADPSVDSHAVMLVADADGCRDTARTAVHVLHISLWVPNAFTPDEETNSLFVPIGEGVIEGELFIYNRQGLLVCHQGDYRQGWDGTHDGIPCKQEAYVWLLVYRTAAEPQIEHRVKGTVTLLR